MAVQNAILIVEDEVAIAEMVQSALDKAGFDAVVAGDAASAEKAIRERSPALILLDWMLPGLSGIEFVRRLKREEATRPIPVVMLTAKVEEQDRIAGFEAGVDDYVVKPFSVRELVARINAVLKRSVPKDDAEAVEVDGLCLDPVAHRVSANERPLKLGPTEYRMLQFFMRNQERVYSRAQLLDQVWGQNVYVEERTVDVHIRRLRKTLSAHGYDRFIQTVHGAGYRFSRQV